MDNSPNNNAYPPINYQALAALQSKKHQAEAQTFIAQPRKANRKIFTVLGGIVVIGIIALLIFPPLLFIVIFGGLGWLVITGAKKSKQVKLATAQFLADNGWQPAVPPPFDLSVITNPQTIRNSITDGFSGTFGPDSFWSYFFYSYFPSNNGSTASEGLELLQVISVAFNKPLPRFYVADRAGGHGVERYFKLHQTGMVPVHLEGNFDQYFTLYMDPQNQADVLTIIDPSRMLELVQHGSFVEVFAMGGNNVHFLNAIMPAMDPVYTQNFFDFSQQFTCMLDRALTTFQLSQPVAAPSQQIITPTVTPA